MIFGINTKSDISKLFYIISRAVRRVKFGAIFEISLLVFMPNITYNSWYYLFILQPEKFSHLYFQACLFSSSFEVLVFGPAGPKGVPRGGPGVPVTPPFASLFNQTT